MKLIKKLLIVLPVVLATFGSALGQSTDPALPTAILSNEVSARIPALDLGDPRMTRHYYAFEGTPGDLVISINSRNLNGDMDVFTAVTLRPLMKISIYANTMPPEVTKSIYLRTKQTLILRIEARSPNDDVGNYRIRFSGSFAAFSGGIPVAETSSEETGEVASSQTGSRRLSSVGATINQPPEETPTATPEPKPSTETAAEKPAEEEETKKEEQPKPTRKKPAKATPSARNPRRRTTPARTKPTTTETETAKTEPAKTDTEEPKKPTEGEEKPDTATEKPATEEKPKGQEPAIQPGAHLIIEEKDGTRIDRPMSTIRRVIVEGNQIVIVLKSGRTERIPMSDVTRMSIEPPQ
ncbi:MAG: hypothetical protein AABM67_11940 [Acidobacteriota bacterium]